MLPVGDRNTIGGREVEASLKAVILNYRIENKEKFKHNFRHDAMDDSQRIIIKFSRIVYVKLALAKKEQKHISSHLLENMHM